MRKRSLRSIAERSSKRKSVSSRIFFHLPNPCRATPFKRCSVSSAVHFLRCFVARFPPVLDSDFSLFFGVLLVSLSPLGDDVALSVCLPWASSNGEGVIGGNKAALGGGVLRSLIAGTVGSLEGGVFFCSTGSLTLAFSAGASSIFCLFRGTVFQSRSRKSSKLLWRCRSRGTTSLDGLFDLCGSFCVFGDLAAAGPLIVPSFERRRDLAPLPLLESFEVLA